jgi:hypothetical protein
MGQITLFQKGKSFKVQANHGYGKSNKQADWTHISQMARTHIPLSISLGLHWISHDVHGLEIECYNNDVVTKNS